MQVVVCGHCRTSVAPRADGSCPSCCCPVDGSPSAQPRTVQLGPPFDPGAAARQHDMRHLLLGAALVVGSVAALALSWRVLTGGSELWKPVVIVGVTMLFRGVWEWWQVDARLGGAFALCLLAGALGLPGDRKTVFFPIAAVAALYAAHRIRTVVLRRRRDAVPAARVHSDEGV